MADASRPGVLALMMPLSGMTAGVGAGKPVAIEQETAGRSLRLPEGVRVAGTSWSA